MATCSPTLLPLKRAVSVPFPASRQTEATPVISSSGRGTKAQRGEVTSRSLSWPVTKPKRGRARRTPKSVPLVTTRAALKTRTLKERVGLLCPAPGLEPGWEKRPEQGQQTAVHRPHLACRLPRHGPSSECFSAVGIIHIWCPVKGIGDVDFSPRRQRVPGHGQARLVFVFSVAAFPFYR